MTLLTICVNVARETGFPEPSSVVGSADLIAVQLLAHAQREGKRLIEKADDNGGWSVLQREHTITTADGTAAYALPAGYDRYQSDVAWDRTNFRRLRGSMSPQQWQVSKSGLAASLSIDKAFRVKWDTGQSPEARMVFIDPPPSAVETLVIEFLADLWCEKTDGTGQNAWAADTDVGRLDEELMELGVMWRFLKSKGLSYLEEKAEYENALDVAIARDTPARSITMGEVGVFDDPLLGANMPDSGFGV